jgi:hypothetical protein
MVLLIVVNSSFAFGSIAFNTMQCGRLTDTVLSRYLPSYSRGPLYILIFMANLNSNLILKMKTDGIGMIQGKPMLGKRFAQESIQISAMLDCREDPPRRNSHYFSY